LKEEEFMTGNFGYTETLLNLLIKHRNKSRIVVTSSIQAKVDNPYGRSKKAGEDLVLDYGATNQIPVYVYRLSNLFGKWSRPNYNSVVATFCHNISHDLPIQISDPSATVELCHIDDVIGELLEAMDDHVLKDGKYCIVEPTTRISLADLSNKLISFRQTRTNLHLPVFNSRFDRQLYGTYLSYLEPDDFGYYLKKISDQRGWLAEFIKSPDFGQVFVSKTLPGITRGNHWHHTKAEKFLVVAGKGEIRFRKIHGTEVIVYPVDGDVPQVLDIPTGYTHSITNTSDTDLITLFYSTEIYDPQHPDTYFQEV
jgi:UDP-2-acetamido-2,6-beta-L-arabino-hexul-4-ose reductase